MQTPEEKRRLAEEIATLEKKLDKDDLNPVTMRNMENRLCVLREIQKEADSQKKANPDEPKFKIGQTVQHIASGEKGTVIGVHMNRGKCLEGHSEGLSCLFNNYECREVRFSGEYRVSVGFGKDREVDVPEELIKGYVCEGEEEAKVEKDGRTLYGRPIRDITTREFYPAKVSMRYFLDEMSNGIRGFERNGIGQWDKDKKYIEDWVEHFLSWSEIEND